MNFVLSDVKREKRSFRQTVFKVFLGDTCSEVAPLPLFLLLFFDPFFLRSRFSSASSFVFLFFSFACYLFFSVFFPLHDFLPSFHFFFFIFSHLCSTFLPFLFLFTTFSLFLPCFFILFSLRYYISQSPFFLSFAPFSFSLLPPPLTSILYSFLISASFIFRPLPSF